MQLGFVSAILADQSLEQVMAFAKEHGFQCVELLCWPRGKAERRYAGVTHVDVSDFTQADAARVKDLVARSGVAVSGLGYYPNPLAADPDERRVYVDHIKKVIVAAEMLGLDLVNSFIGRDPAKSIEDNWPVFEEVWPPLIRFAEQHGMKIGIENCPMLFSLDEWPGGKNLAISPSVWRKMFEAIPSRNFGLNYDPSHMIWQQMDHIQPIYDFRDRLFHVHAKDEKIVTSLLNDVGNLGLKWHIPKLPGLGDVRWGAFFSALTDIGYKGAVCIEIEDRAYEDSLADRQRALLQSKHYLEQYQL
jgi:sugar phosphate isomerase/epimerase